ncbi:MAG: hypothetical protein ACT4P1_00955 [Sporichthyaceae bacterium]
MPLALPVPGRKRVPSSDLYAQRGGVDYVLAAAALVAHDAEGGAGTAPMAALVEAVLLVLAEETDTLMERHRERLAGLARFGWAVGAGEDGGPDCVVGLTHPHVDTALLYLALENRIEDPMAKAVADWVLEAAYYLRRTSRALADVLTTLYVELPELFPSRMRPVETSPVAAGVTAATAPVPAQRSRTRRPRAVPVGNRG